MISLFAGLLGNPGMTLILSPGPRAVHRSIGHSLGIPPTYVNRSIGWSPQPMETQTSDCGGSGMRQNDQSSEVGSGGRQGQEGETGGIQPT